TGDVERPDADPVVRDPEPDAALGEAVRREEVLERFRQRIGVAQFTADDDARVERSARDLLKLSRSIVRNPRGCKLRRTDLQSDEVLRALGTELEVHPRPPGLRGLRRFRCFRWFELAFRPRRLGALLAAERQVLLPEGNL